MAIQEQTGLTAPETRRQASPRTGPEWTARPLRPVARWVEVAASDGTSHLEMVWSVPDPRASDLY